MDIPTNMPDGSVLWMDHEFIRYLHEGKPEIGLVGDPRLAPFLNGNHIEIRRADEQGNYKHVIMKSKPGVRTLGMEALVFLAEHDSQSRRAYDVVKDVNESNARAQANLDTKRAESRAEAADRLAHALYKDVGHLEGGSTRQYFPVAKRKGSE